MKSSFQKILILFFTAILATIIVLAVVSSSTTRAFRDTSFWVGHTQNVLGEAEQISSLTKDLQLEGAGYYFTGDSSFLYAYYTAKKLVLDRIRSLKNITVDNPSQQKRLESVELIVRDLITFSELAIQERKTNGVTKGFSVSVYKRKIFREKINDLITATIKEEKRLLVMREAANTKSISATSQLFDILIGIIFILLITGFLSILYNHNKRRKAEEELRESDERFQVLVNNIKDLAIFMIDKNGYIINWYRGAENVLGYSKVEIIGKHISVFYTVADIEQGLVDYNLKTATAMGSVETEGWRVKKDGSKFWADIIITAINDEKANVQGFTVVARDYTLHKKAEDEIKNALEKERELSEMKSNFVSMASHEFRTPLSSILSSASLITQYTTTEQQDKRERHVKRISFSVSNLISILDEFLSLEKIEEGKVEAKIQIFNLKELITQLLIDIKTASRPAQVITYEHDGEERVNSDISFITHIVTNLTTNAVKYSSENTPVSVHTEVTGGIIRIRVKDEGMGISEEDQKRLFERFFRSASVANIQGTGLGLHITKRYVDLMKGTIKVKSVVGKGSEFIVEVANVATTASA